MAAQVALRRQQAREENEARELGLLYGCHEGLLAMHRAGFTFSAAMAHMLSGRNQQSNTSATAAPPSTTSSTPPPDWKRLSPSDPSDPPSPKRPRLDPPDDPQPSPPADDPYDDDDDRSKEPPSPPPPPTAPPQEPLDLHHPKKSPIDVLARVFPRENRSILNVVLQRNGGDVLQAIDDLLSSSKEEASSPSPGTSSPRPPPLPGFLNPHSFFPAGPFRRPFPSPPARGGLMAVPAAAYSGFFPGMAPYPGFFGTSSAASSTSTSPEECKKWSACGNPSPQDLSSPDTKSPNGYND